MRQGTIAVVLAVGFAFAGSTPGSAATPLRVQLSTDVRSTNPGVNRDSDTDAVVLHMVEGLVAYGEDARVKPLLAESVAMSEDGLTYTFKLRKGVKFHNGAGMTSADVVWSWNRYMDPKTEWRCFPEFDGRNGLKVTAIEAPDPMTVLFRIDKPNALFLNALARTDCGMTAILHKDSVKADGSWDKPVGTGPFQLDEWKRGEYIQLARFSDYANRGGKRDGYTGGKRPLVDHVRFMVVPDSSTAKAALLRGDIDIIPDVTNADAQELKSNPAIKLSVSPHMGLAGLLIQTRDPIFANAKIRQAVAAAINGDQVVAAVTEGLGKRNNSIVPTLSSYYKSPETKGWSYDPAKAKRLLTEAGYKGEPIVMLTNKRFSAMYDTAIITQAMLKAAGFNVSLEVLEWATQLDRYNKGNYQMMSFTYSARLDPAQSFEAIMGAKDKQPRKVWDNPEAQKLLERAMVVADEGERQKLFDRLHEMFIDDVPMIMLYNGLKTSASAKRAEGFESWSGSLSRVWEVRLTN
ncbi:ABC transporter substrate-binding protein [Microvirga brassicacearum]|uniref:ABC transporter substrate-binding protein n=2 Tax=Microvirga brassicacearum TaxID=2580413 RepID=A0A5N3P474_9HYPH|nr:ABC transporter substrate-binding protein [Microvirga brassicacearum]KAB0264548.1 ABC transporter substrate-binding protein [Microvirga brassicacearum]